MAKPEMSEVRATPSKRELPEERRELPAMPAASRKELLADAATRASIQPKQSKAMLCMASVDEKLFVFEGCVCVVRSCGGLASKLCRSCCLLRMEKGVGCLAQKVRAIVCYWGGAAHNLSHDPLSKALKLLLSAMSGLSALSLARRPEQQPATTNDSHNQALGFFIRRLAATFNIRRPFESPA